MKLAPAHALAAEVARFFDAAEIDLPNPLVYANYAAMGDAALRRSLISRNAPGKTLQPPVSLLCYPPGTRVHGDRSYLTVTPDGIVAEQRAPWCADPLEEAQRMLAAEPLEVAAPCVLLARYGENTWGHWVAEMLVKAAIVERASPGRFLYAVPWWTTEKPAARGYASAVLESLAAFGVAPNRLVRMAGFQVHRFAALHDVGGIDGRALHPGALHCLRAVPLPPSTQPMRPRVAFLRRAPLARAIHNATDIQASLASAGFALADLNALPFIDQLRLFREAEIVVGSLGSDFAGALFAPEGARLVTLAPAAWADGYFIRMFQRTAAFHADIRGPSTLPHPTEAARAPHFVDPASIAEGIEAVRHATDRTGAALIDGEAMPRRLGPALLALTFGAGGNAAETIAGSWSDAEPNHLWSLGPKSELHIDRNALPGDEDVWLQIQGQGHVYPPYLPTRPLAVTVNGVPVGQFDVIGRTRLLCPLPRAALNRATPITLTFDHPICPSPRLMGGGPDDRPLGFGFETLTFFQMPA